MATTFEDLIPMYQFYFRFDLKKFMPSMHFTYRILKIHILMIATDLLVSDQ